MLLIRSLWAKIEMPGGLLSSPFQLPEATQILSSWLLLLSPKRITPTSVSPLYHICPSSFIFPLTS